MTKHAATFDLFARGRQAPLPRDGWTRVSLGDEKSRDWQAEAGAYIPAPGLEDAVNVAIALGKPLLVTGEPGLGKTRLAYAIAWQLSLDRPFKFVAKSTSEARDLFYNYDAVGRFYAIEAARHLQDTGTRGSENLAEHQRKIDRPSEPRFFIEYTALGRAILLAHPAEAVEAFTAPESTLPDEADIHDRLFRHPGEPSPSVVLIDEIDKAEIGFCNDLLDEIDTLSFSVPEIREEKVPAPPGGTRPIVLITSNRERELPAAFLRRCVYFHIPFPPSIQEASAPVAPRDYYLENILSARLSSELSTSTLVTSTIAALYRLRNHRPLLTKLPGTAEFIDLVNTFLTMTGNTPDGPVDFDAELTKDARLIEIALSVLVKSEGDRAAARAAIMG